MLLPSSARTSYIRKLHNAGGEYQNRTVYHRIGKRPDARLRTDFNVMTGIRNDRIRAIKENSEMKKYYAEGQIPIARQVRASEEMNAVREFATMTGYPIIAKPDVGVGASGTFMIANDEELVHFFETANDFRNYVVEEFITGDICSYDAIIGAQGEPFFESMTVWPPSIMDGEPRLNSFRIINGDIVDKEIHL